MESNVVYQGDCMEVMQQFPDNCIDTIITDPPYFLSSIKKRFKDTSINDENLTGQAAKNGTHQYARLSKGFMGKAWDNEIAFNPDIWYEALRVAKPGAILLAFGGTRTYHRLTCAIEDAGWEIRDCIMWIYGSGFPKSLDVSKAVDKAGGAEREVVGTRIKKSSDMRNGNYNKGGNYSDIEVSITASSTPLARTFDGYGSALKPAYEPLVVAMKPLDGTYANNAEKWGVSGLWIDGGRVEADWENDPNKRGLGYGFTKQGYDIEGTLSSGMGKRIDYNTSNGRWPANVIHDGSDEVLAEFDKAGVRKSDGGLTPHSNPAPITVNGGFIEAKNRPYFNYQDVGTPARFFYCAKASSNERGQNNNHPTVKPLSLLKYLCRITRIPYGGIVLDPFAGSGTTALAAIAEKRDFILIEKEPEYAEICKQRIAEYTGAEIVPKEIKVRDETVKQLGLW